MSSSNAYNQQNIKPFKGGLVKIEFEARGMKDLTGIIRGNHRRFIIFDVNKSGFEIKINYSSIKSVERIKSKNKEKK
jgi:hypothetical protein